MTIRQVFFSLATASCTLLAPAASNGHHSFAMFDQSRYIVIEGHVTQWDYNNPHSWLHIDGLDANDEMQTWSFEGAAPVHAARQGVTGATFRKGEFVRVVMSPLRDGRNAGAICFVVKDDGSIVRPNDGNCDSPSVIAHWQANGWIEGTAHLEEHPAEQ